MKLKIGLRILIALSILLPFTAGGIGTYCIGMVRPDAEAFFLGFLGFGTLVIGAISFLIITNRNEAGALCANLVIGYWILTAGFVALAIGVVFEPQGTAAIALFVVVVLSCWGYGTMTMVSFTRLANQTRKLYEPSYV